MRKTLWWAGFAVVGLLTAFVALAFCLQLYQAISGNVNRGQSRGGAAVAAVILLLIAVGLATSARLIEHRAHQEAGTVPTPRPPRSPRHTPHSNRFGIVVLSIVVGIFLIMTIVGFVDWHRSQSVQHDGLRVNGIVTQVHAIEHSSRYGSYHTYNLDVALLPPQLGHTTTTVHTPDRSPPADIGDTVAVLLDRSDPGYAELPGHPANSIDTAIVGLVFLLLIGGLILWAGVRHHRVLRAASVATG
jgi:ABC-type Fe3+ transport system permease subunit